MHIMVYNLTFGQRLPVMIINIKAKKKPVSHRSMHHLLHPRMSHLHGFDKTDNTLQLLLFDADDIWFFMQQVGTFNY